ncbi:GNAT family N-acetyltransferase [Streptomyces althioticus]|uniref:GNAT family N-acetyltransferase n=1 Tax=Streptomyces althioticus TaxID=83380 RepID=UPI0036FBFA64
MSSPQRTRPRPPSELRGHGLLLRAWDPHSDDDAEAWLRGLTDPEFRRWNTPLRPVGDLDGARRSLRTRAALAEEGAVVSFHIADAADGTPLGHIGIDDIRPVMAVGRIGYWVLPEARGRGVATRAALLAADWALTEGALHRLELGHAVGHEVSCRVANRCGFLPEGTLRDAMFAPGRHDAFRDTHLHARLATDPTPPDPSPPGP